MPAVMNSAGARARPVAHRRPAGAVGAPTPALPHATAATGPRVSVVVASGGRLRLLLPCLRALQRQTLDPQAFEIVVVDDGHNAATREAVRALARAVPLPRLRYMRPGPGLQGLAAARNLGWRFTRGAVLAFTDDDTVPLPDWLAQGERAMRGSAPGGVAWAALGGLVQVPGKHGKTGAATDHDRIRHGVEPAELVTANAFVARSALLRVHGFDLRFTHASQEGADLQYRLQALVGPVGHCEQAVVLRPLRAERWGASLRQHESAFFEALLFREHARRYRARANGRTPWGLYATVGSALAAPLLLAAGRPGVALACALLAGAQVLRLAAQRLRGSTCRPRQVLQMLATSALIPFLSVYWRLRGALHFRVWFL